MPTRNQNGQVAILFALIFTFMFILFAFVVDFGHLINTKINLQLAADSAAYSGAAYQANTLNRLGMINYHIRQDIKELAMRLWVTHIRHNNNFPHGVNFIKGANQEPAPFDLYLCQQAQNYVALSGRFYEPDTNLCQNASPTVGGLPPIFIPPVIAGFDPLAIALQNQIRQLADVANKECREAALDNESLTDHLINTYARRTQYHLDQANKVVDWLNQIGDGELKDGETHPIRQVAFQSARRNFVPANYYGNFKIEVLGPPQSQYIKINPYQINGRVLYVNFNVQGDGCVGLAKTAAANMVAGFSKENEILTYFAVKISTKPRMFFMPQVWVDNIFPELVAVSAAKPFGSRIGPPPQLDEMLPTNDRPGNANPMINFSFFPGDTLGFNNSKLLALFDALHPLNEKSRTEGNQQKGWPDPGKGGELRTVLQLIHAPTIFDALYYPIFPGPDNPNDYVESQYAEGLYPDFLEASNIQNAVLQIPSDPSTKGYLDLSDAERGPGWIKVFFPGQPVGQNYSYYANEQPESHALTLAPKIDGFLDETNETEFGYATRDIVHSGWTPDNHPGRLGYSVRFVPFEALGGKLKIDLPGGGQVPISNPPQSEFNLIDIRH